MRVLGVDFGSKRIGIAVGETEHAIASPRTPLAASGTLSIDAAAISALAKREEVVFVVVGLPLDIHGEPTKMSRVCLQLAERIRELGWSVQTIDESLTSAEGERAMREAGLKGSERRARSDGESAVRILERYFATETTSP